MVPPKSRVQTRMVMWDHTYICAFRRPARRHSKEDGGDTRYLATQAILVRIRSRRHLSHPISRYQAQYRPASASSQPRQPSPLARFIYTTALSTSSLLITRTTSSQPSKAIVFSSGSVHTPSGPSADHEPVDWNRVRSWPGLARARGRGAGGWGR
jgi:hypothetical protein